MIVCLLWSAEDYYAEKLVAVYADMTEAAKHLQAIADAKPPFPGSERLSVEEFTEHAIEAWVVAERYGPEAGA